MIYVRSKEHKTNLWIAKLTEPQIFCDLSISPEKKIRIRKYRQHGNRGVNSTCYSNNGTLLSLEKRANFVKTNTHSSRLLFKILKTYFSTDFLFSNIGFVS